MQRLRVVHSTVYRYRRPVTFGEHRLMFRPRDSHDLRLVSSGLVIEPAAQVRWLHDVFSNSIAIASFSEPAETLSFESRIDIDHYAGDLSDVQLEPFAQTYPFSYASEEIPDLGRTIERHYPDENHAVDLWAKRFVQRYGGPVDTLMLLGEITRAIPQEFSYRRRYDIGTRAPAETLQLKEGTCRDLALLMMEAVRSLGFAARFVSGYLYDPALDQGPQAGQEGQDIQGGGETHAWVQVYLPGGGWVEFDPTNGLIGGQNLIRIAVTRDPAQALPLQGSFMGAADDFLEMEVDVRVTRLGEASPVTPVVA